MENNIFEGAKFGDKFLTRDGRVAIYACNSYSNEQQTLHFMILFDKIADVRYDYNGIIRDSNNHKLDIVSRYQEPIDEDKLDNLAKEYNFHNTKLKLVDEYGTELEEYGSSINAYKAGYRKAMEE